MLLEYDNTICNADWQVEEKIPPGYCRVYYVYGGQVQYTDNQRQTELRHGYLYIFPSASPYKMEQNASDPLCCTFMHMDISPSMVTNLIELRVEKNGFLEHLLLAFVSAIHNKERKLVFALAEAFELFLAERGLTLTPVHSLSDVSCIH